MYGEVIFRVLFTVLWIVFLGLRALYGRKAQIPGQKRSWQERWKGMVRYESVALVILRVILFYLLIIFIVLYVLIPPWLLGSQLSVPSWLRWIGVGLGIITIPFLIWVGQTLGKYVSGDLELRESHLLITSGPYSRVRHPMYTVYFTFNVAMVLVSANWLLILLIIIGLLLLYGRIRAEEQMMLDQFGDEYHAYMKRTGRLLPRFRREADKEE